MRGVFAILATREEKPMLLPATYFIAGAAGAWRVDRLKVIRGPGLPAAQRIDIVDGPDAGGQSGAAWILRGVRSNLRYTTAVESAALTRVQPELGRPAATQAALIPIRKNAGWWALAQDERRAIFEERSRHIRVGLDYLPAVARRLYHCRDLGETFDFLTWFEFAPKDAAAFDRLVAALRTTPEWSFVDREVDLRLTRLPA